MNIAESDELEVPDDETILWRYMDLAKFLGLISNRELFFSAVSSLSDGYEGMVPATNVDLERQRLVGLGTSEPDLSEKLSRFVIEFMELASFTFVNCWSIAETESYALWKVFVGGSRAGVAIQTTVGRLRRALAEGGDPEPEDVYIGKVKYREHIPRDTPTRFDLLTTKMPFYTYEDELRALILRDPRSDGGSFPAFNRLNGRRVQVDLDVLIEHALPSPFVGEWFPSTLHDILSRLDKRIASRLIHSAVEDR